MRIAARSDQGKVRDNNEDCLAFDARLGVAVLADGMGGLRAGEVASSTAVEAVMQHLVENTDRLGTDDVGEMLREALELANRRVYALADSRREFSGMGTTLVVGAMYDGRFVAAHIGDSRAYRFRNGELARLTSDHSLVQQLVEQGILSAAEARRAPNRNIVTRAVGIEMDVECDLTEVDALAGDVFLLCSDGLTDMIDDATIARFCEAHAAAEPTRIVDVLVNAALIEGGFDNVSVVVLKP
ncbi:MAG TPA: Stp1/IreP family PP2C-type Ser/Thr phosphatase [Pseudomonadales bacterium]|jgi:serine/threonine protein phosphatase PrpC|nr:Stp1/IreP family PP2C-type Ser/Thr phosphatase [Pseudomonadales bacterium]